MKELIIEAIKNRRLLSFRYEDHQRLVEPHLLGVSNTGHTVLSAYQVEGGSSSCKTTGFRLFLHHKMSGLSTAVATFSKARPGYNPNDATMKTILAKL